MGDRIWITKPGSINVMEGAIGGPDGFDTGVCEAAHAAIVTVEKSPVKNAGEVLVIRINPRNRCADAAKELRELFSQVADAFEDGSLRGVDQ